MDGRALMAVSILFAVQACGGHHHQTTIGERTQTASDGTVEVSIHSRELKGGERGLIYWGCDEQCLPGTTAADRLTIRVGAHVLNATPSSYADLADIRHVAVHATRGGSDFEIVVEGADAAACYVARLRFRDGNIVDRMVRLCEFPDDAYQETNWHYNNLEN